MKLLLGSQSNYTLCKLAVMSASLDHDANNRAMLMRVSMLYVDCGNEVQHYITNENFVAGFCKLYLILNTNVSLFSWILT